MKTSLLAITLLTTVALTATADETSQSSDISQRDRRLANYLSGSKFVGKFTVIGEKQNELPTDEYTLLEVEKLPQEHMFMIKARIQYGKKDMTVPLPIPIRWAGQTPVITLDDFTIPSMGTFSAKVVISNGRYAGTWRHDDKGGHMFGVIEKAKTQPDRHGNADQ